MIKVLNVISALNNAGTEEVVMNYYRNLDRNKIQYDFLVLDMNSNYHEKEIISYGGKVYHIPPFTKNPIVNMKLRKKIIKEGHYDYVEVHSPSAERFSYCKLGKKYGSKTIFHIHNTDYRKKNIILRFFQKKVIKYSDSIVTCSQFAAESVIGRKADFVVYNAINYDKYCYRANVRKEIRDYYNIDDKTKIIGTIGRFSTQKNHLFLLEAFSKITNKEGLILLLKGYGEKKKDILDFIEKENLKDYVILDEKFLASDLYNSFDLYVAPSLFEGLSVSLIEAQVNGLKLLVSDRVSTETSISKNVTYLPLDVNVWTSFFENKDIYSRVLYTKEELKKNNYDIITESRKRELFYLNNR